MKSGSLEELNNKVRKKIISLELMAVERSLSSPSTKNAIEALAEFAWKLPDNRLWTVLTLTLEEGNGGLRIAPDLARALITSQSPDYAVKKYREEAKMLGRMARISFRADVTSYWREDGSAKKGPEHFVPLVESEIDWKTGIVRGKYLFYMLRYEVDTTFNVFGGVLVNTMFRLRPTPEYEGVGFRFAVDGNERLVLEEADLRAHFGAYRVPIEMAERTRERRIKVTAVPDNGHYTNGHANFLVLKDDPETLAKVVARYPQLANKDIKHALDVIIELNPQIDFLKHLNPKQAFQELELVMWGSPKRVKEFYERGERYDVRAKLVMDVCGERSRPCSDPLIANTAA